MVGFCGSRYWIIGDNDIDGKFSINQSSNSKPGEKPEELIINLNKKHSLQGSCLLKAVIVFNVSFCIFRKRQL